MKDVDVPHLSNIPPILARTWGKRWFRLETIGFEAESIDRMQSDLSIGAQTPLSGVLEAPSHGALKSLYVGPSSVDEHQHDIEFWTWCSSWVRHSVIRCGHDRQAFATFYSMGEPFGSSFVSLTLSDLGAAKRGRTTRVYDVTCQVFSQRSRGIPYRFTNVSFLRLERISARSIPAQMFKFPELVELQIVPFDLTSSPSDPNANALEWSATAVKNMRLAVVDGQFPRLERMELQWEMGISTNVPSDLMEELALLSEVCHGRALVLKSDLLQR
jgi:hypothetical protein